MILELELQELCSTNYITYDGYKCIATEKAKIVSDEVDESLEHFNF